MIKAVFDTVVFVRALINPYSFCGQFFFKYSSRFRLFVSQPIVKEILAVLQRPKIKKKYQTDKIDFEKILKILAKAENVRLKAINKVCRDEKDNIFLATALAVKADFLVSEDKDLLDLQNYRQIKIVGSASFLRIIRRQGNKL